MLGLISVLGVERLLNYYQIMPKSFTAHVRSFLRYSPVICIAVVVIIYALASTRFIGHLSADNQQSLRFDYLHLPDATVLDPADAFALPNFTQLDDDSVAIGFKQGVHLFRSQLQLPANEALVLFLHTYIEAPLLDVHLKYADGRIISHQFGTELPFWQRPLPTPNVAVPIEPDAAQVVEVLIATETYASIGFIASLAPATSYTPRAQAEHALSWLMIGGLLLMGLYNLFLSWLIRSALHFYYSTYVFSLAAMQVVLSGYGFKYLWYEGGAFISVASSPITVACVGTTASIFARKFLAGQKSTPWADRAVQTIPLFALIVIALMPLLPMIVIIELTTAFAYYFMLLITLLALAQLRLKNPNARPFVLAWMFLVIGGSLTNGVYQGVVPANFFTANASNIGGLLEAIVLALALANQLNTLRSEKARAEAKARLALQQRNDALEESNRIKDRFLATISHELRTPLNSMIGSFDLLKRDIDNAIVKSDLIDNGLTSGEHLNALVDKLLEFTEIESGHYQVSESTIELSLWFDSLQQRYQPLAKAKQLEFRCTHSLANSFAKVDSDLLSKIVVQLLDNAFRFTEQGHVIFQAYVDDRMRLRLFISDSGQGIPDDQKHWLSQRFSQLDQSEQRQHGGLGVGLALTQAWVKLLKGQFNLTDSDSGGVAINIQIPVKISQDSPSQTTQSLASLQQQRALIVEDNPINQKVLAAVLQRLYITSEICPNGVEAVQLLKRDAGFDFIMMDCEMPVMDGYQCTQTIRQQPSAYQQIPIFAVTANAMSTDRDRCLAAGMNDYLAKPIRIDSVRELIERWFELPENHSK